MAFKEDVNSPLILTIGAISGFLVIVCVIGLQAWFMSEEQRELDGKYATAVNYRLTELRSEQQAHLQGYRWIDPQNRVAAIPIDEAMKLLIENKGKLPSTQPK
jgi:hypothetical protein